MKKNYSQIISNDPNDLFLRNKSILLYLVFLIHKNINKEEEGQKRCEELDSFLKEKFINTIKNSLYRHVHNIKISLITEINKKNNKDPKYNSSDFTDSIEISALSCCNTFLNFTSCFSDKT